VRNAGAAGKRVGQVQRLHLAHLALGAYAAQFALVQHGDLRDLLLRPFAQRDTVVVGPNDLLVTAWQRMKLYDVSQLPVMDGERLVGIVDESDVLMHVHADESRFRDSVSSAMITSLQKLDVRSPVESLLPVFERGHVAIVVDGDDFLGLITRIDLLNWLRRKVN
jgi:cystathionine beta-synthase